MHQAAASLQTAIDVDAVSAKGTTDGAMIAGKRKRAMGSDLAPALAGLPDDHCQCPHWGYVIEGEIEVTYQGGARGTVRAGDHCDWPARKGVRVTEDRSDVAFSPVEATAELRAHVTCKMWLR